MTRIELFDYYRQIMLPASAPDYQALKSVIGEGVEH